MLIGFKLRNFRSFLGAQLFSYSTSPDRAHASTHCVRTGVRAVPRLFKTGVIFGPNAGGKTNLIIALATMRDLALHSVAYTDEQFSERHTPFCFGPSAGQPTEFEVDVLLDKVRYRYAVSYDSERIRSEQLLVYRTGKSQRWFERRFDAAAQTDAWSPFSPNFHGPREMWRKATRPTALFLTTAAQLNSDQLKPLLQWFEHGLEIVFPVDIADMNRIAAQIQDPGFKAHVSSFLRSVGIRVDDVRVARGTEQELPAVDQGKAHASASSHAFRVSARTSIEFLHSHEGFAPVWLGSDVEAAGTLRLLGLFGSFLDAIKHGKVLAIDEFDVSLHPLVARFLLELINDPAISCKGAQLLLTSHDVTLMDLDILRRDEIWLMELDHDRASSLSPVLRSSPRKRELIGKGYLRGRYRAVPAIRLLRDALPVCAPEPGGTARASGPLSTATHPAESPRE